MVISVELNRREGLNWFGKCTLSMDPSRQAQSH